MVCGLYGVHIVRTQKRRQLPLDVVGLGLLSAESRRKDNGNISRELWASYPRRRLCPSSDSVHVYSYVLSESEVKTLIPLRSNNQNGDIITFTIFVPIVLPSSIQDLPPVVEFQNSHPLSTCTDFDSDTPLFVALQTREYTNTLRAINDTSRADSNRQFASLRNAS